MTSKCGYRTNLYKIGQLTGSNRENLRQACRNLVSQMIYSRSRYAKGRLELWLFHQSNLQNPDLKLGYFDDRLWKFCQRVYPGCNIGLLTFGDCRRSRSQINWHRDQTYAKAQARIVNLGEALFGYDSEPNKFLLQDGDIIDFNCKILHCVQQTSEERFSLCLWQLNEAKGYHPLPEIAALMKS